MFPISQNFDYGRKGGAAPLVLFVLTTSGGQYAWAKGIHPTEEMLGQVGPRYFDGSYLADGSAYAGLGSIAMIEASARVVGWGELWETLSPDMDDPLSSWTAEEASSITVSVANEDGLLMRIFATDNLNGATAEIKVGFVGCEPHEFVTRATFTVRRFSMDHATCSLELEAA